MFLLLVTMVTAACWTDGLLGQVMHDLRLWHFNRIFFMRFCTRRERKAIIKIRKIFIEWPNIKYALTVVRMCPILPVKYNTFIYFGIWEWSNFITTRWDFRFSSPLHRLLRTSRRIYFTNANATKLCSTFAGIDWMKGILLHFWVKTKNEMGENILIFTVCASFLSCDDDKALFLHDIRRDISSVMWCGNVDALLFRPVIAHNFHSIQFWVEAIYFRWAAK